MTTYIDRSSFQAFFADNKTPKSLAGMFNCFPDGRVTLSFVVTKLSMFPRFVNKVLAAYPGDEDDHRTLRRICQEYDKCPSNVSNIHWVFLTIDMYRVWLAKAAVALVLKRATKSAAQSKISDRYSGTSE
jgi:hypothetical protein